MEHVFYFTNFLFLVHKQIPGKSLSNIHQQNMQSSISPFPSGMLQRLSMVLLVSLMSWTYQAIQPPPPRICGSPNCPPVTSSRIKLRDGRHIAYLESGVPKENATYKIIFIHGFHCTKHDVPPISPEILKEYGVYFVSFDRPGYGESDPNPKLSEKNRALDIEELADKLQLGPKFHVIGYSMGGEIVWSCLKFIPHRLAGAAMISPVSNFWWPNFPANVSKLAFQQQPLQDQWAVRVAHYAPWLTYWWNTQKWFPASCVISNPLKVFSKNDLMLLPKLAGNPYKEQVLQQGEYGSLHNDLMVGFGRWEFDPMDLENPISKDGGSVHLWHGDEDIIAPVALSQYIAQKLSWINYHEIADAGHMFPFASSFGDTVVKTLLSDHSS